MRIILTSLFFFFVTSSVTLEAQSQNERGYYLVESEKFSPPVKELIASFENKMAEGFLASDIYGKEHFLNDYRGKPVFLFFYDITDDLGRDFYDNIEVVANKLKNKVHIIGMAVNNKTDLITYYDGNIPPFPVIPNGEVFGQMAYGADLGSPRLFAINSDGIIKRVLPSSLLHENQTLQLLEESYKLVQ